MSESSAYYDERARKIHTTILNHLSDVSQVAVCDVTKIDQGVLSKIKNYQLESLSKILAACGLKVVPVEYHCIDPKKAQAMVTLYEAAMEKVNAVELLWGDE